jgi:hypothetical protein
MKDFEQPLSNSRDAQPAISMVLLLRRPHRFTEAELRAAAEKAWGISFGNESDQAYFVSTAGDRGLIYAGSHLLTILSSDKPYFQISPTERAKTLPHQGQRKAWSEHHAWTSVDYSKSRGEIDKEYGIVAKLTAEMLDENCLGIYVPQQLSFIPNMPSLYDDLQRISTSRGY